MGGVPWYCQGMNAILQFGAVTALGLAVAYLVKSWVNWYGDFYPAIAIWIAGCFLFAAIYDYRNRRRQ